MSVEYGIVFEPERCVACHGCAVACKVWRERPLGVFCRRIEKIWLKGEHMPRLRHASVACQHCAEPACMEVCPEGAISKGNDGIVRVDGESASAAGAVEMPAPMLCRSFPTTGKERWSNAICASADMLWKRESLPALQPVPPMR